MTYDKIMIRTIRMRGNRDEVMMIMTKIVKKTNYEDEEDGKKWGLSAEWHWQWGLTESDRVKSAIYAATQRAPAGKWRSGLRREERRGVGGKKRGRSAGAGSVLYYSIQCAGSGGGAPLPRLCHSLPTVPYPPQYGTLYTNWHTMHKMAHYAPNGTAEVGLGNNIEQ